MAEFNLSDLEKITKSDEVIDFLVDKKIIKESKLIKQYEYEKQMRQLQYAMVQLQAHIIKSNQRLLVVFEGRDAAGKGGTIKRIVQNINPKKYKVIALSKPTEQEQNQWYFQRYLQHLPQQGEMVFYDRSWYNRAVVEPVFGFCTPAQYQAFNQQVNQLEQLLVKEGIILIKFFLDISKKEQQQRLDERANNPLKQWKLGSLDKQAQSKWDTYTKYINLMLQNNNQSQWVRIATDSKKEARINTIQYLLSSIKGFSTDVNTNYNTDIVNIHTA